MPIGMAQIRRSSAPGSRVCFTIVTQPICLNFWFALGARISRAYDFLCYFDFYRMLLRFNAGAVSVRINLSKLCAKEKDLRCIVDPQEERDQGTGRTIC